MYTETVLFLLWGGGWSNVLYDEIIVLEMLAFVFNSFVLATIRNDYPTEVPVVTGSRCLGTPELVQLWFTE